MRNNKPMTDIIADAGLTGDARQVLLEMNQHMTWQAISEFFHVSKKKVWEFMTENQEKKKINKAEYVRLYHCASCNTDKAAELMRTYNDCQRCAKMRRIARV